MEKMLTEANKILRNFPDRIPGAMDIIKHETFGAKYCAVHVGAMHPQPVQIAKICAKRNYGDDASEEQIRNYVDTMHRLSNEAQKDVYSVLNFLYDTQNVREIRMEGVAGKVSSEKIQKEYDLTLDELSSSGYFKKEFEENDLESFRYLAGGDIVMALDRGLKITAGEDLKIRERWQGDFMSNKNDLSIIEDAREDYIIKGIAEGENVMAVFTFGMGHKFIRRINHWNKYNPNSKLSLIEILGKGPAELEKLI